MAIEKTFYSFSINIYQPIIESKMAFGSLLGSSKWSSKFWWFLNTKNLLLIDCIIVVYGQKISNWDL